MKPVHLGEIQRGEIQAAHVRVDVPAAALNHIGVRTRAVHEIKRIDAGYFDQDGA